MEELKGKAGFFYCPECMVEFYVNVEPHAGIKEVMRDFPSSLRWFKTLKCFKCGNKVEKR